MSNANTLSDFLTRLSLVLFLLLSLASFGLGEIVFIDTFEDGDLTNDVPVSSLDGDPVMWQAFNFAELLANVEIDQEQMFVSVAGNESIAGAGTAFWGAPELNLGDMSIRAQVRLLNGTGVFLNPVRDPNANSTGAYFGVIGDGTASLRRGGTFEMLEQRETDLVVTDKDIVIQIDAIGSSVSLWAWPVGDAMPELPLLTFAEPIDIDVENGDVWVGVIGESGEAAFDYVHVETTHITDLAALAGDFNRDGELTVADIEILSAAIVRREHSPEFDLNQDDQTDISDLQFYVHDLLSTWFGDSNLDGEFNSSDLVSVFRSGEFEDRVLANSTWATGDWNGDGEFDSSDFVVAFQDGGFEIGPRTITNVVPEPTSLIILTAGLLGFAIRRRGLSRVAIEGKLVKPTCCHSMETLCAQPVAMIGGS